MVVLCSVNATKYYLGRLVSRSYGEVVVLQRWSLRQVQLYLKGPFRLPPGVQQRNEDTSIISLNSSC